MSSDLTFGFYCVIVGYRPSYDLTKHGKRNYTTWVCLLWNSHPKVFSFSIVKHLCIRPNDFYFPNTIISFCYGYLWMKISQWHHPPPFLIENLNRLLIKSSSCKYDQITFIIVINWYFKNYIERLHILYMICA